MVPKPTRVRGKDQISARSIWVMSPTPAFHDVSQICSSKAGILSHLPGQGKRPGNLRWDPQGALSMPEFREGLFANANLPFGFGMAGSRRHQNALEGFKLRGLI
jgi:hypothetical protein